MNYLKSLIRANTLDSSKSFVMIVACVVGAVIGLTVCVCLLIDVWRNGHIVTDLDSLGLFLLCAGGYMAGGGLNKALSERKRNKEQIIEQTKTTTT